MAFERILHGIEKPGRYLGGEVNIHKRRFEETDVRFLLAFPDVYEVGLSHLGLQILYHLLNGLEGVLADRAYTPWMDFEERLRTEGEPLRGIETGRAFADFDFIGFSLQYELSYTNILTMLDLGRIPFRAAERSREDPWIIAGGPCAFNPEPLAEFFDFFVLGEAEEVLPEIVAAHRAWKASGEGREAFLDAVRKIGGIYVPSLFDVAYGTDGTISAVTPRLGDYTAVRRRLIPDLDDSSPIPEHPIVPIIDIVHNRLGLEIARGCTRGCRFCQASFIYRPVRERDPRKILEKAERAIANSGFEDVSLLSLSTGDYCQVQPLLAALMERLVPRRIAVSFPSMRVGTLTPELMELIRRVRKTGFTLAPEAGSERLRRVINKGILDDELMSAAESAFRLGWRVIKLYFMTGLPTETAEDRDALVDLALRVWQRAKPSKSSVNVSVSTFVPKPMTPFQWAAQISMEEMRDRVAEFKTRLRKPGVRFKWHHPEHSFLEGVFARGDRRLWRVLVRAWELGARFDGWTEILRFDAWRQAFEDCGVDPAFYATRERPLTEILPWDHLSSGVDRDYLVKEAEKAASETFTEDCRFSRCTVCGACDHKEIAPKLFREAPLPLPAGVDTREDHADEQGFTYRLTYSKIGNVRFFGALEVAQAFSRAIRRAGLPAAYSKGFHPHVRLSFDEAMPLGLETEVAEALLTLKEPVGTRAMMAAINARLPEGLHIEEAVLASGSSKRPAARMATYRVFELSPSAAGAILRDWPRRIDETITKKTKKGSVEATLGDILRDVRQTGDTELEIDLVESSQRCFRPTAILELLLGRPDELTGCRIRKTAIAPVGQPEEEENVRRAHHKRYPV